jgi:2-oxoglutarate ferredoxin oxidoreductase subunit alpha
MQKDIPYLKVDGDEEGELLVLGWGGTAGTLWEAVNLARERGLKVSRAHLNYLNPFPSNLGDVLSKFKNILVPEINLGQLAFLLRSEFLIPVIKYNKMRGLPLRAIEVTEKISEILGGKNGK